MLSIARQSTDLRAQPESSCLANTCVRTGPRFITMLFLNWDCTVLVKEVLLTPERAIVTSTS